MRKCISFTFTWHFLGTYTYMTSCKILKPCNIYINILGFVVGGTTCLCSSLFCLCSTPSLCEPPPSFWTLSPSEQNVYVPPCVCGPFMFPCFHDGVPMLVMVSVVHTFAPLCHFLCAGIRSDKANAVKFEGAHSWCFLQVNKTMNFDLGLLLFLFSKFFFYFLVVLCLVVLFPFILSFVYEVQRSEVKNWSMIDPNQCLL